MNEHPTDPLDRLIVALARKAAEEHFARAAEQVDPKKDVRAQAESERRVAA